MNLPIGFSPAIDTPQEVEMGFLASCLSAPLRVRRYGYIQPEMLYDPNIGQLWRILKALVDRNLNASGDILSSMVENDSVLAKALSSSGTHYRQVISSMAVMSLPDSELATYVDVIVDRWKRRQAMVIVDEMRVGLEDLQAAKSADDVLAKVSGNILGLQKSMTMSSARSIADICTQIEKSGAPYETISTGYERLDEAMGGGLMLPGLIVFEARPKTFKTGTLISLAYNLAKAGNKSSIITLEMPEDQILMRMIAAEGKGNARNYANYPGRMRRESAYFRQTYGDLITFYPLHGGSFASIQNALWSSASAGYRVIFLDYFQLITGCPVGMSMLDFREEIAGWMQAFTNQTKTCLVVAAQVGRSGETYASDGLNRNATFVGQLRDAEAHSEKARMRKLWLETRFSRHSEPTDLGGDDFGPLTISDVGPMLDIEEKLPDIR